jgi:hypothetical protein
MRLRTLLTIAGLVVAGCTGEAAAVGTGALTGSVGVLHVERSGVDGTGRTVLRAAFARYHGIDGDSVLHLLGAGSAAEIGSCVLADPADELAGVDVVDVDADVELLDVGALRVTVAHTEARLSPRTFPDLASVLAGVFYAEDAALAMPEPEVDEYRFVAEGGVEVGAFDVLVPAPAVVGGLELVGADGTSARLDGSLMEITRSGALTLQWDGDDPRDLVEIEITSGAQRLACVARDEGSFRIGAEGVAALEADSDARLVVRRVRISPFDATGIDVAFARVAAARSFPLAVR